MGILTKNPGEVYGRHVLALATMIYEEELKKNTPVPFDKLFEGILDTHLESRLYYKHGLELVIGESTPQIKERR